MRKLMLITLFTILYLAFSLPVNAQEARHPVGDGYTPEGVHYTVYAVQATESLTPSAATSIYVVRDFIFDTVTVPPQKMEYHEIINGISYVGTLTRSSIIINGTHVTASYRGTLYRISAYTY